MSSVLSEQHAKRIPWYGARLARRNEGAEREICDPTELRLSAARSGIPRPGRAQPFERHTTRGRWRHAVVVTAGLVAGLLGGANDATAQPAPTDRIVVRLDVGWRPASRTFGSTRVFPVFSELGNFQASYAIDGGGIVDGGISFLLWRNLAVGLDVSRYRSVNPALITVELPHPFFFDLPRATAGVVSGLERRELGAHLRALWAMQLTDWLVVSVSGGPSLINARQDLVSSVEHTEVGFPFDHVIFSGHTAGIQSQSTIGVNWGLDIDTFALHKLPFLVRYEVMSNVGLGVLIRYVRGSVDLQLGDEPVDVDLGGLQITSGLRFRF